MGRAEILRGCLKSGWSAGFHKLGEHDFAGSDVNGGLGMLGFSFIILSQTPVTTQPSEGALDQPAFGQDVETGSDAFDNLDLQAALRDEPLDPVQELAGIAAVGEDLAHPAKVEQGRQEQLGALTILQGGAVDHDGENQSQSVDQEVSFSSVDLLASVVATFSGLLSHFNALAVDNRSTRGFFFALASRTPSRNP